MTVLEQEAEFVLCMQNGERPDSAPAVDGSLPGLVCIFFPTIFRNRRIFIRPQTTIFAL